MIQAMKKKDLRFCRLHQNPYYGLKYDKCEESHNKWIAGKRAAKEAKPVPMPDPCAGCDNKGGTKERPSCLVPICVRDHGWTADRIKRGEVSLHE